LNFLESETARRYAEYAAAEEQRKANREARDAKIAPGEVERTAAKSEVTARVGAEPPWLAEKTWGDYTDAHNMIAALNPDIAKQFPEATAGIDVDTPVPPDRRSTHL